MLRETRKYIEENFKEDRTLSNVVIYIKRFSGYWKIILSKNWFDLSMDDMFERYILNTTDIILSKKVLILYSHYGKKYSRILNTQKIKTKQLNAKQIAILVNIVKQMDASFSTDMKKLLSEHRENKMNEDF